MLTHDSRRTLTHDARRTVTYDGVAAEELRLRCGVPHLELLAEADSTQNISHLLAERGAAAGTVVLADAQRAGRGRFGRAWSSEPGAGVWCTVLERPQLASAVELLSVRVGLRVAEALDAFAGGRVGLKWPNDLMRSADVIPRSPATSGYPRERVLQFAKLGGILIETRWSGATLAWVAIGVGINVVTPTAVPDAVGLPGTPRRAEVFVEAVRAARAAAAASGHLTADELARYAGRDVLAGRSILSPVNGTVVGIARTGALVVETRAGTAHVQSGTIRLAGEERA
jgi:BirA family biotin operon repressor/biotin-[acetyl-CoA-carboxylase] ligase